MLLLLLDVDYGTSMNLEFAECHLQTLQRLQLMSFLAKLVAAVDMQQSLQKAHFKYSQQDCSAHHCTPWN